MRKTMELVVIGLAMFAMFFGAGNLIFPPYLGMQTGPQWFIAFLCFFIADIGLAFLAVIAMTNGDGTIASVTRPVGKIPALLIGTAVVVCIGPLVGVPRTAATTFEMLILPIFPGATNAWLFSILYFAIVVLLTIRPSKVVDIIGKVLTPLMVAGLLVLIVLGIVSPIGEIASTTNVNVYKEGIVSGYQTMDVIAALLLGMIILRAIDRKGYHCRKSRLRACAVACVVAGGGLFIVYGGLAYLGATAASAFPADIERAPLLIGITNTLMGTPGIYVLGGIVALACLTTAIGLVSCCASYFEDLSGGRLPYAPLVIGICAVCMLISNIGLNAIIAFAEPVLLLLYPAVLTLMVLSYFKKRIKNHHVYQGAVICALLASLLSVLEGFGLKMPFLAYLPLADFALGWIVPACIGGLIGHFIPVSKAKADRTTG